MEMFSVLSQSINFSIFRTCSVLKKGYCQTKLLFYWLDVEYSPPIQSPRPKVTFCFSKQLNTIPVIWYLNHMLEVVICMISIYLNTFF